MSWPPAFPTARPPSLPGDLATSRPELLWQHTLVSLAPLALEYRGQESVRTGACQPPPDRQSTPDFRCAPASSISTRRSYGRHSLARPRSYHQPAPSSDCAFSTLRSLSTAIRSTSPCVRPASAVATKAHLSVLTSQHRRRCSHEALHIRDRRADRRDERRGCPLDYMDR